MHLTPSELLVVFALKSEATTFFDDMNTLFCGVGKVNATYNLTRAIAKWENQHNRKPAMVINAGSAGSSHFKSGTTVNCTRFLERDMDATALSFPPFATPFDDTPVILKNGERIPFLLEGACGTGDNFSTTGTNEHWSVVDMEAYALAKVCAREFIPFCCIKHITDGADESAALSWEQELAKTAKELRAVIDQAFISPTR